MVDIREPIRITLYPLDPRDQPKVVVCYDIATVFTVEEGLVIELQISRNPPHRVERYPSNRYPKFLTEGPIAQYDRIGKNELADLIRYAERHAGRKVT